MLKILYDNLERFSLKTSVDILKNIMIKLLRRNKIEEELGKNVKIFGKTISVNVIYSKIYANNKELAYRIYQTISEGTDTDIGIIVERIRIALIVLLILLSRHSRILFNIFIIYEILAKEISIILIYFSMGIKGVVENIIGMYPQHILYLAAILIVWNNFVNIDNKQTIKSKKIRKKKAVNAILTLILTSIGIVLEVITKK